MKSRRGFGLLAVVVIVALLPALPVDGGSRLCSSGGSMGMAVAQPALGGPAEERPAGERPAEQRGTGGSRLVGTPGEGPGLQAGAPAVVSYQGQVQVNGLPYTGTGYVKFAVVDAPGTTTYWSNNGTSTGGSEPTAAVTLAVSGGLFNVLLGDTTLTNMTTLPAGAFSGTDRYLRVWFSSNGTTFTQLAPDRRVAAVPYALQATDADTLDGLQGSAYQQRVSGSCAVGSTIRAVNADGSVVCTLDAPLRRSAPPEANASTTVDSEGDVGMFSSITIGADGLPVVSYVDATNYVLKVLHCGNAACTAGNTITTVDAAGVIYDVTSITIGADGLPVIAYSDDIDADLRVLHCGNAACTAGNTITTGDATADVGWYCSITIGADGLPVISYHDYSNVDLKVLHCGNAACSSGNTITTVDATGDVGLSTSITLGADGLPVVSYYDDTNDDLKVLHCGNAACTAGNTITTVDVAGSVGWGSSITIGAGRLPVISYHDQTNRDLKVLHCGNAACTAGNAITTVDATGEVGYLPSITIGANGLPVVSHYDNTNKDLKVLYCGNAACTAGNTAITLDATGDVGWYTSITIGVDGLPVIGYRDYTNLDLKVLHCGNAFCTPYWRRR